jgi:DNA-binding NarL/FixJ family response regulator
MTATQLPRPTMPPQLTPREVQVLRLIAEGLSTHEIADVLGRKFKTVACHRARLLQKFNAKNAMVMVLQAIRLRIISL